MDERDQGSRRSAVLGIDGIANPVEIGHGSFGVVYRADQPSYRRVVAVKVLNSPMASETDRRHFERECEALGSLSGHPNIVTLYSAGEAAGGKPYLIMAFLDGGSLADRIKRDGPLDWAEVTAVGVKLSGALNAAHHAGIIHRDVKPENVLTSKFGEPQLADFGVARFQDSQYATLSATITGSLAHSAPEVIDGMPATAASDICSLASTMSTAIAGQSPFHRPGEETLKPIIARILTQPPRNLRPLGVPPGLCDILDKAMAKDPGDRYVSVAAFGQALRHLEASMGQRPTDMVAVQSAGRPGTYAEGASAEAETVRVNHPRPDDDTKGDPDETETVRVKPGGSGAGREGGGQEAATVRVKPSGQTGSSNASVGSAAGPEDGAREAETRGSAAGGGGGTPGGEPNGRKTGRRPSPWSAKILAPAAALVVLVLGGAIFAITRSSDGSTPTTVTTAFTPTTATSTPTTATSTPTTVTSAPTTATSAQTTPTTGVGTVAVPSQPDLSLAKDLASTLSVYFNAIDTREWQTAWQQFTPTYQANNSFTQFQDGDSTSTDSAATLLSITPGGQTVSAVVTFKSQQAAASNSASATCDVWTITYNMINGSGGWKINSTSGASDHAC